MATIRARAPRASWAKLWQTGNLNAGPEPVAPGYAANLASMEIMCDVTQHCAKVAMVVVIERVACVSLAWHLVREIFESTGPQNPSAHALPITTEVCGGQALDTRVDVSQSLDRRAGICLINLD